MSDPRWSDETATMVRQALSGCATARGYRLHDERDALADAALAALADAGLLVPPDAERVEQQGVSSAWDANRVSVCKPGCVHEDGARAVDRTRTTVTFTTPWTEVTS